MPCSACVRPPSCLPWTVFPVRLHETLRESIRADLGQTCCRRRPLVSLLVPLLVSLLVPLVLSVVLMLLMVLSRFVLQLLSPCPPGVSPSRLSRCSCMQ